MQDFTYFLQKKDLLPKAGLFQTPLTVDSWLLTFLSLRPRRIVDQGDEYQIFFAGILQPMGTAVLTEGHISSLNRKLLVFVGVFPFAFEQVVGLVVPQVLVDRHCAPRMQGDLGK